MGDLGELKRLLDAGLQINSYAGHDDDCVRGQCSCGYSKAAETFLTVAEEALIALQNKDQGR